MSDLEDMIREMLDPKIVAADSLPEVILIGGPRDQWTFIKDAPLPNTIKMPLRIGVLTVVAGEPQTYAAYHRVFNEDGLPSLDDDGRHRYTYDDTPTN